MGALNRKTVDFLSSYSWSLGGFWARTTSEFRNPETILRVIYHKRKYGVTEDGSVKPRLFQPRQGEVSTIVKDGAEYAYMCKLAYKLRPKRDRKKVVGFAVLRPHSAFAKSELSQLEFEIDYKPIARHGNVVGWETSGDAARVKERNLHLAHQLALHASSWLADG